MDREYPHRTLPASSAPVVDENGVRHPTKAHMERYKNWRPGMHQLGDDPQAEIERLVVEFLQEKHDECNGEKLKIEKFLADHDRLVEQCWMRIEKYEREATAFRARTHTHPDTGVKYRMHSFNWRMESPGTIRAILRLKEGKKITPRTFLERMRLAMWREEQSASDGVYPWRSKFNTKRSRESVLYLPDLSSQVSRARALERKLEPVESILADVSARKIKSGIFHSVRNTKEKKS